MEDTQEYNTDVEQAMIQNAISESVQKGVQSTAMQYEVEEREKNLAEAQLECSKILTKMFHMLRQDVLRPSEDGSLDWIPLKNDRKRILTNEGVDRIMQVLSAYVNKETLLSNFSDEQINDRMLRFSLSLNSNIYQKYEIYFRSPTIEECKEILTKRINEKIKIRKIAEEFLGNNTSEEEIKRKIMEEIEDRIEYELNKIKIEERKIKIREYELLFTEIEAIVYSIHNRAYKGEERSSLRRHFNISEVIGGNKSKEKKGGIFGWGEN